MSHVHRILTSKRRWMKMLSSIFYSLRFASSHFPSLAGRVPFCCHSFSVGGVNFALHYYMMEGKSSK